MNTDGKIVWLASYPKSGNTWLRFLLGFALGLSDEDEDAFSPVSGISSSRHYFDSVLALDTHELTRNEIDRARPGVYGFLHQHAQSLQFVKAHDRYRVLPDGRAIFPARCSRAAIYIVRNPLDVAVSYAHHLSNEDHADVVDAMSTPNRIIGGGTKEQIEQDLGDWSGHFRSWTLQGKIPVLVIRYEDMKENTELELRRIFRFLEISEDAFAMPLSQAVEKADFTRLQELERERGFAEKPVRARSFFRSGRVGDGCRVLPAELIARIVDEHGEVMRELGYS
ncbi:sulfotransferase domain-containing protein [Aurantiacibacter sp. MUD61]|uniref:sulfotransferase domain-containing protein n=1 Tax=Aurantiacibacter sp. MUD61 TaxID=3009083 RepID=UPI0022F140A7|nr:sulfotransferase domain-containing protein [Aurantiacibacter sp. MUD61]